MASILMIEDELQMRNLVNLYVSSKGHRLIEADCGHEGLKKFEKENVHLVILDIMMPDMDGWEVCKQFRERSDTPLIMLTAKVTVADRVKGLKLGADDYLTKPFHPDELLARIEALLRRVKPEQDLTELIFEKLHIHLQRRVVIIGDTLLDLTPKEFDLLLFLVKHPGRVFDREQLLNKVWGIDYEGDKRTVDTHIKSLRMKMKSAIREIQYIHTIYGVGYKWGIAH
jgi:two-component system response regulator ResD